MIFPDLSSVNVFLHLVAVDEIFNSNTLKRSFLFTEGNISGERGEWGEGVGVSEGEYGEEDWQGGSTWGKGYSGGGLKFCFQLSSESLSLSKV